MILFPSGDKKIMKGQDINRYSQSALDSLSEDTVSKFRASPTSENIVQDQNAFHKNVDDFSKSEGIDSTEGNTEKKDKGSLKEFILEKLQSIGVPPRQIQQHLDKILEITTDLGSGSVKGFYLIPTFTSTQKIGEKEASSFAAEIGSTFGLDQKMKTVGRNYRIDFSSKAVAEPVSQHGTSFDSFEGSSGQKSASSLETMLRESRERFYDNIIKTSNRNIS